MSEPPPLPTPYPDAPPVISQSPATGGIVGAKDGQSGKEAALPPNEIRLSGRPATMILLVFLGAQFGAGFFVAVLGGIFAGVAHAIHHSVFPLAQGDAEMKSAMTGLALILGFVAGGVAMVLMSVSLVRERLGDCSPTGAAWVYGPRKKIAQGFGVGVLVALCYALANAAFQGLGARPTPGPLTRLATTPGLSQLAWSVVALLLAPPIEELLFRGVLYGGYRRSLGAPAAAALTTSIFVVLHLSEIIQYLPSALGIAGLALTALWFRLRSAAIGPAVAVHFGYNLVIVLATACYVWR